MTHPWLIALARRLPLSSRLLGRIDELQRELAQSKREAAQYKSRLADASSRMLDRSRATFDADGLIVLKRQVPFLSDPKFQEAYRFGVDSGHGWGDIHV